MSKVIYYAGLAAALSLGSCGDRSTAPMGARDTERTAAIRRAVVSDESLSTGAKNVRIVTVDGRVTLTGTVGSSIEKALVLRKAIQVAGAENVIDELSIPGEEELTPSALPRAP